jgi:hypothetical protein
MRPGFALAAALLAAATGCGSTNEAAPSTGPLTCANVVRDPVLPDGWVQDLGTLPVGARATFEVPPGTSSFVIMSQEVGHTAPGTVQDGSMTLPNAVVPTNVRDPDGTLYYDDFASPPTTTIGTSRFGYADVTGFLAIDQGFQAVLGALPFPTTAAGLDRLAADGQVKPGTWSFTLNDWAFRCPFQGCTGAPHGGHYRVEVVRRPGPAGGTLDLDVYLATDPQKSPLPDAATAAANPQASRLVSSIGHYLAGAGISLGQVRWHDLPASVRAKLAPAGEVNVSSSDPCGPLAQLFTNASFPGQGAQLFVADVLVQPTMSGSASFQIAGVDGSIPGPSGYPGTIGSGAIVGLESFGFEKTQGACSGTGAPDLSSCGTDWVAYFASHEIGHWLGLFHTTEQDGTFFDPLSDTARCACLSCAATATQRASCAEVKTSGTTTDMTNDLCISTTNPDCGGGRNLMFWLFEETVSTGELSGQQGAVMRLNPGVR